MNTFKFIGQIKKFEERDDRRSNTSATFDSGWTQERVKFRVVCGNSSEIVEVTGGKYPDNAKNVVYTTVYKAGSTDQRSFENAQIKWEDRLKQEVVDSVPHFKKYTIDLASDKIRRQAAKEGVECSQEKYSYISSYDFVLKLRELLDCNGFGTQNYVITGEIECNYSMNKDGDWVYFKKYTPRSIYLADAEEMPIATAKYDFYYDVTNYMGEVEENGDVSVFGYTPYYDRSARGTYYYPITLCLKKDYEKSEPLKNLLALDGNEGDIAVVGATVEVYNGVTREKITEEDLTPGEIRAIKSGVKTLEQIVKDNGGYINGSKVRKFYFLDTGKKEFAYPRLVEDLSIELLEKRPNTETSGKKSNTATSLSKGPVFKNIDLFDDDDLAI